MATQHRPRTWILAALAIASSATLAMPHTGEGFAPPPPPTGRGAPSGPRAGPTSPGGIPSGGPTTPGGAPGGGPTTPGGPGPGAKPTPAPTPTPRTPSGRGGAPKPFDPNRASAPSNGGVDPDHWSLWWYANRRRYLDRAPSGALTPGARGTNEALDDQLWRAEAAGLLSSMLRSDDDAIVASVAVALGKVGDPVTGDQLLAMLADADRPKSHRESAAFALGLIGAGPDAQAAQRASATLERIVRDSGESTELRAICVYALGLRGETQSVPFLSAVADTAQPRWDLPVAGLTALGLAGDESSRELLERHLAGPRRNKESMPRIYAAQGLARLGDRASLPALVMATRAKDEHVRRAAFHALGELATADDSDAIDALVRAEHRERDRGARNAAAIALGKTASPRARAALTFGYEKGDRLHQAFAAIGMGLLARGTDDPSLVSGLHRDLEERANADLRGALAVAVGLARRRDAAPILRELASDQGDLKMRAHATLALGMIGDRDRGPDVLRTLLTDERDPTIKWEAGLALGLLGNKRSVPILAEQLAKGSSYTQASAAIALGHIGGKDAAAALSRLLRTDDATGTARAMAAIGLGLALDRDDGERLALVGSDVSWSALTPTARFVIQIL